MTSLPDCFCVATVICGELCRLPTSFACLRRRCTASSTPAWSAMNASPSSVVQPSSRHIMSSVSGNCSSARTGGVKPIAAAASSIALPLRPWFSRIQLPASSTSCGFAEAISTCESTGSGYSAIGASRSSSASALQDVGACAAACWTTGAGVACSTTAGGGAATVVCGGGSFEPQPAIVAARANAIATDSDRRDVEVNFILGALQPRKPRFFD